MLELRGDIGAIFNESGEQAALLLGWRIKSQVILGYTGTRIEANWLWLCNEWRGAMKAKLYGKEGCVYTIDGVKFAVTDVPTAPWPRGYLGEWAWVGKEIFETRSIPQREVESVENYRG